MKRFFKIVGIFSLFAIALGYFGFRILFFDPFESDFPGLDGIIPRDVHSMVRRRDLHRDFHTFPRPEFFESLKLKREWKEFTETGLYQEWEEKLALEEHVSHVEAQLAQLRPLDPLRDLVGREVMVVGRDGADGEPEYAFALRVSFVAKLGTEALSIGFLRGLFGDALAGVETAGRVQKLSLADGTVLYLFRRRDLVVVGFDAELVQEMRALADDEAQGLSSSPSFVDAMAEQSDVGRPLDFTFHVAEWAERSGVERFEPADEFDVFGKWLSQSIVPTEYGAAMGRVFLGDDSEMRVRIAADLSQIKPRAGGLYSGASADLKEMYEFCGRVLPPDVFCFAHLKLDVRAALQRLEAALDPDTRELIDEFLKAAQRRNQNLDVRSSVDLVTRFSECFANEVLLAFEPQRPYHIPGTPPDQLRMPLNSWGPRFAVGFPMANRSRAEALVDGLLNTFKSSGREKFAKVYGWSYESDGYKFWEIEWLDPEYPPLAVGFVDLADRDFLLFTTTGQFLDEIVKNRIMRGKGGGASVGETLEYRQASEFYEGFGQGVFFLASEGLRQVLSELAAWTVENETRPDWTEIRRSLEVERRDLHWPSDLGREVSPEQLRQLNPEIDEEMERRRLNWLQQELPDAVAVRRKELECLDLFRWLGASMRVNDRNLELRMRLASQLNFQ